MKKNKKENRKINIPKIVTVISLVSFFSFLIFNFININYLNKEMDLSKEKYFNSFVESIKLKHDASIVLKETLNISTNSKLGVFETEYDNRKYQFKAELTTGNNNLHHILSSQLVLKNDIEELFPNSKSYTLIYLDDEEFGKRVDKKIKNEYDDTYELLDENYKINIYDNFFEHIVFKTDDYLHINIASNENFSDKELEDKIISLKKTYNIKMIINYYYTDDINVLESYNDKLISFEGVSLTTFNRDDFVSLKRITYKDNLVIETIKNKE